ncbi:MAG: MFS transporter [Chloroflexota bacterium]|nr:MFS transporter [Chloroflexota bacterium]
MLQTIRQRRAASGASAFGALQSRAFALFWPAISIALTGTWMRALVQGYFVYDRTRDPFQTALVQFFQGLPVLVLSPLAGVAADRFDRRKLLAIIQVANAVPAFGIAALSALGRLEVWHVYVMATCIGAASAFDWPARLSLVPNLVPREQLQSAVALNSASFNFSRIIGPAIGGLLIGPLGVTGCFFIAALCYIPFILTLLTVLLRVDLGQPTGQDHHPFTTLREGYAYIWSHKTLRALLSIDLIPVMLGMTYFGLLPALARDVLHRGSGGLGVLQASAGLGALIGVLIVALLTGVRGRGKIVLGGMTGFGLALLCFGLSHNFYLSCGILLTQGILADLYGSMNDTLVQTVTEDAYRGRVMAVYSMIWGLTPIGSLEGGTLAHFFGVRAALATNGFLVICFGLLLWRLLGHIRRLD